MEFKLKQPANKLTCNIQKVLPLIEEITKAKVDPLCLIGFSVDKKGEVHVRLSTISDDPQTESVLLEIFRQVIEAKENKK